MNWLCSGPLGVLYVKRRLDQGEIIARRSRDEALCLTNSECQAGEEVGAGRSGCETRAQIRNERLPAGCVL